MKSIVECYKNDTEISHDVTDDWLMLMKDADLVLQVSPYRGQYFVYSEYKGNRVTWTRHFDVYEAFSMAKRMTQILKRDKFYCYEGVYIGPEFHVKEHNDI